MGNMMMKMNGKSKLKAAENDGRPAPARRHASQTPWAGRLRLTAALFYLKCVRK